VTFRYRCSECGLEYEILPGRLRCDRCAALQQPDRPLRGILEVVLEGGTLPTKAWHTLDLLPVERRWFPAIPVGDTPLWRPERLCDELGSPGLVLKDDGLNPTGSLKDRASYLVAAFARRHGIRRIVVASTGNAGSSMAGIGAAAGLEVRLYLPASAPRGKLVQSLQYGADLQKIDGSYDRASAACRAFLSEHDGLSRNTGENPLTIEGKKTVSLEIFRQLGDRTPDHVFVSTGDGVIAAGVYKGFEDLVALGLADRVPQIVCVQAEGSSAIARALEHGEFTDPVAADTVADSISVAVPAAGYFTLARLQRHRGRCVVVSDRQIQAAQRRLASAAGCFVEPAAAAAFAGYLASRAAIDPAARVVVLLTGTGLKDIDGALRSLEQDSTAKSP